MANKDYDGTTNFDRIGRSRLGAIGKGILSGKIKKYPISEEKREKLAFGKKDKFMSDKMGMEAVRPSTTVVREYKPAEKKKKSILSK